MKPVVVTVLALLACVSLSNAQEFEVATLKVATSVEAGVRVNIGLVGVRNGIVTVQHATLAECIQIAYGLVSDSQIVGPDWITRRS
jgi:uncharacterized protein (TIGR03435 family)